MDKLHELYGTIDHMNHDELKKLREYIDQRMMRPQIDEDPQTRSAALMAALADFWDGLSQAEIDEIVEDMNAEYIEPLSKSDWFSGEAGN